MIQVFYSCFPVQPSLLLSVYDGTDFLFEHPGGEDSITGVAGEDASEDLSVVVDPLHVAY